MTQVPSAEAAIKPWATQRRDNWWLEPALVAIGFGLFIIYATWRAFENAYYQSGGYLSPFYSPDLSGLLPFWQWSPAILILWIPAGFRATCYYYRKAYYRAYFMDPPACAVGHLGGEKYGGETTFPLIMQNIHRYMLYFAIAILLVLWYDAFEACFSEAHFHGSPRIGLGTLIFFANVILLSGYTFGCHVWRHIVGGRLDCFSCSAGAQRSFGIWNKVTKLNAHHMLWAWLSLFSVGFTDFYVRLLATGAFVDPTIIGG